LRELSRDQIEVYHTTLDAEGGYALPEAVSTLSGQDMATAERTLELLAAIGLARPVCLRVDHPELPALTITTVHQGRQRDNEVVAPEDEGL
jgi:hypothetical protein